MTVGPAEHLKFTPCLKCGIQQYCVACCTPTALAHWKCMHDKKCSVCESFSDICVPAQELRAMIDSDRPTTRELSQLASKLWAEMPEEEQAIYKRQCDEMKKDYRGYGAGGSRRLRNPERPKQPTSPFLLWRHSNSAVRRLFYSVQSRCPSC